MWVEGESEKEKMNRTYLVVPEEYECHLACDGDGGAELEAPAVHVEVGYFDHFGWRENKNQNKTGKKGKGLYLSPSRWSKSRQFLDIFVLGE